MQKLIKLYAVNPELLKVLTFKPGIGQNIALQASTAVWNSAVVLSSQFIQLLFLFSLFNQQWTRLTFGIKRHLWIFTDKFQQSFWCVVNEWNAANWNVNIDRWLLLTIWTWLCWLYCVLSCEQTVLVIWSPAICPGCPLSAWQGIPCRALYSSFLSLVMFVG